MGERDGIAIDEPRALWWCIDDSDSWERSDALRRISPSATDEGIDVTDESLRASGEGSSVASGERGVIDEDSLREGFLLEKMDGFLPKMEVLGVGDGSGAMLILCLLDPYTFRLVSLPTSNVQLLRGRPCMQLRIKRIGIRERTLDRPCYAVTTFAVERGSLLRHRTRLSRPAWRVKSPTRATKAKRGRRAWTA